MKYDGLEYIRKTYNVCAFKGVRVAVKALTGPVKFGTITGSSNAYVLVKLDGESRAFSYHPDSLLYEYQKWDAFPEAK